MVTASHQAQNASTSASSSVVATLTGSHQAQNSTHNGTLDDPNLGILAGSHQAQDASTSASASVIAILTGSHQAQNATVNTDFAATGGRDLDSNVIQELPEPHARMDLFLEIQFDNGTERYWTGTGNQTLDGDTFTGDGTILNVGRIKESLGLRTDKLEVQLSALNSTLKDNALTKPIQDEQVNLWLVFWDDDMNVIGEKVQMFKGHVDDMQINVDPDRPTITLRAETGAINWSRARPRFYDPEDQKQEFPNDKGFDFVPQLSDLAITWGSSTIRPPSEPGVRNIVYGTDKVSKQPVFYSTKKSDCFLHVVQPAAGHKIDKFKEIYLDDELAWTNSGGLESKFSNHLRVNTHLGTDNQSADSDLVSEVSEWTTDHKLRGVAYVYLRFKLSSKKYPQGMPQIHTVVKGKDNITDPRDNTDKFTENPALCMRDYILDSSLGLNNTTNNLNDVQFKKIANQCDELVDLKGGGTEKRYTLNGSFNTNRTPRDILREMRDAMAGFLTYASGQYIPYSGVDQVASATYDNTDLADSYNISTKRSRSERFNSIRGKFNNKDERWSMTNYPAIVDSSAKADDNDKNIWQTFDLPSTDSHTMAQRIANIELNRNRKQKRLGFTFATRELLQNVAGDIIRFTHDWVNWSKKKFRIMELIYNFTQSGGGTKIIPEVTVREYGSSVYDWDPANDEKDMTAASSPSLANADTMHVQQYSSTSDFPSGPCAGQLRVATDDQEIQMGDGTSSSTVGGGKLTTVASGQVTLSNGTGVVSTGESAVDNKYMVAVGVDDPDADTKVAAKLFWDDSEGVYKVEFEEISTSVGNPTVNYSIERLD